MCFVLKSTSELIMLTVSRTAINDKKLSKSINYIRRLIRGNFYPSYFVFMYFVFCYVDFTVSEGGGGAGLARKTYNAAQNYFVICDSLTISHSSHIALVINIICIFNFVGILMWKGQTLYPANRYFVIMFLGGRVV